MYLLDTCICVDFLRGRQPRAYELLQRSDPKLFKIPAVVAAELAVGAAKSTSPTKTRWTVEQFLAPFEVVPFDESCALVYGEIRAQLEREGRAIGQNDLLIAATALTYGAVLVTNNVDEFKRVPGLSLESWQEVDLSE